MPAKKAGSQCMIEKGGTVYHITVDKRLRYTPPKLPLATSFIRKTLSPIADYERL